MSPFGLTPIRNAPLSNQLIATSATQRNLQLPIQLPLSCQPVSLISSPFFQVISRYADICPLPGRYPFALLPLLAVLTTVGGIVMVAIAEELGGFGYTGILLTLLASVAAAVYVPRFISSSLRPNCIRSHKTFTPSSRHPHSIPSHPRTILIHNHLHSCDPTQPSHSPHIRLNLHIVLPDRHLILAFLTQPSHSPLPTLIRPSHALMQFSSHTLQPLLCPR